MTKPSGPDRPAEFGGASDQPRSVEILERWQCFGATWRVVSLTEESVTIALCRCDGGEEVQRLTATDGDLLRWLAGRTSSEQ